jgi:hypothetical protein
VTLDLTGKLAAKIERSAVLAPPGAGKFRGLSLHIKPARTIYSKGNYIHVLNLRIDHPSAMVNHAVRYDRSRLPAPQTIRHSPVTLQDGTQVRQRA